LQGAESGSQGHHQLPARRNAEHSGSCKVETAKSIEIVVDGMENRLVLITVVGMEKRIRGIYGRNKTFKLERSFAMPIELERMEVG